MTGPFWPVSWPPKRSGWPYKELGTLHADRYNGSIANFEVG